MMNQILYIPKRKSFILFFKIELIFSVILLISSILFLYFSFSKHNDNYSSKILDNYKILELYAPTNISFKINKEIPTSPFILGTITIDSLRYNLPYYF